MAEIEQYETQLKNFRHVSRFHCNSKKKGNDFSYAKVMLIIWL